MDRLFPKTHTIEHQRSIFTLIVRVRPSFAPEYQVLISQVSGSQGVAEYRSAEQNIYSQLAKLEATDSVDLDSVAKKIQIRRREFRLPPRQASAWLGTFLLSLNKCLSVLNDQARQGKTMVTLDGTIYDVAYIQGMTRFTAQFDEAQAKAIGQWSDGMRRALEKLQPKQ